MNMKKRLKKLVPKALLEPLLPVYHWFRAVAANIRYGFPARKLYVIGVTGTNGKTTTVNMLGSILQTAGNKIGILSSAVVQIGEQWEDSKLSLTTEDVFVLQRHLKQMGKEGVTHVVLEVSSHSIAQSRVLGIPIQGAVFTNLTQDHLDYHKTMENYAKTKRKLIKRAKEFVVLNADDPWHDFFNINKPEITSSYGTSVKADVRIKAAKLSTSGADALITVGEEDLEIKLHLTGKFNVYNASAAIAAAKWLGIPSVKIQQGLAELEKVPGRMEAIHEGQNFTVIVDHAHTPDALNNLLDNLKKTAKGELIVILGADGERDPSKRIPIGQTVAKYADHAIVTDQEPYGDEPEPIRADLIKGFKSARYSGFEEIPDRYEAITSAVKRARAGDLVLVPGLGNQKHRGMPEGKIPWDEREVVREILRKLAPKAQPKKTKKKKRSSKKKTKKVSKKKK